MEEFSAADFNPHDELYAITHEYDRAYGNLIAAIGAGNLPVAEEVLHGVSPAADLAAEPEIRICFAIAVANLRLAQGDFTVAYNDLAAASRAADALGLVKPLRQIASLLNDPKNAPPLELRTHVEESIKRLSA